MVFGRLLRGLQKTRDKLAAGFARLFALGRKLDESLLDELEEVLYGADLGITGSRVVEELKQAWRKREITEASEVPELLRKKLLARLQGCEGTLARAPSGPTVILVVGVNGSGKTTSIAKLTHLLVQRG
ncbi:MAG TPA: signal recognition particle receptor subunit alpha, partial [Planctomycetota bacterium]|nr:signal recognition particle receptor subunit alpha [Planctomycetota bacterium]